MKIHWMEKLVTRRFLRVGLEPGLGSGHEALVSGEEEGAVMVESRDFTIREVGVLEVAGFSGGDFVTMAQGPSSDMGRGGAPIWDRKGL